MTENKGPSVMNRSWRVGDCLRHQRRQRARGAGPARLLKVEGVGSFMARPYFKGVVLRQVLGNSDSRPSNLLIMEFHNMKIISTI